MNHAGAAELQATALTEATANAVTNAAGNVDLETGFSELEVMWAQTDMPVFAKVVLDEIIADTDQVGDVNALINHQTFELMKHGGMGDVDLAAVGLANVDHFDWRFFHQLHLV